MISNNIIYHLKDRTAFWEDGDLVAFRASQKARGIPYKSNVWSASTSFKRLAFWRFLEQNSEHSLTLFQIVSCMKKQWKPMENRKKKTQNMVLPRYKSIVSHFLFFFFEFFHVFSSHDGNRFTIGSPIFPRSRGSESKRKLLGWSWGELTLELRPDLASLGAF